VDFIPSDASDTSFLLLISRDSGGGGGGLTGGDGGRLDESNSTTLTLPFLDAEAATEANRRPSGQKIKISGISFFPASGTGLQKVRLSPPRPPLPLSV
jgi:hypothetical protein